MQDQLPVVTSWGQLALLAFGAGLALKYALPLLKKNHNNSGSTFKDAVAIRDAIMANVDKTRHDLNNSVAKTLATLQEHSESQTDRLVEKLNTIADLIKEGNRHRRESS